MDPFIGEIRMFAGSFAPKNWLFCDGALLVSGQYLSLSSLLSGAYGSGFMTFNLPDLRGRAPMHQGQGPGLTNRILGQHFGKEGSTLPLNRYPLHTHEWMVSSEPVSQTDPNHSVLAYGTSRKPIYQVFSNQHESLAPSSVDNTGGGKPHNNMQPFGVIHFIIATQGTYPEWDQSA